MKRFLSILLIIGLFCNCLVGCGSEPVIQNPNDYGDIEVIETQVQDNEVVEVKEIIDNIGFDYFDSNLINYVNNSSFKEDNYCLSPLSIRLALSLLAEGAGGETQEELFNVLGVYSVNELRDLSMKMNRMAMEMSTDGERMLELFETYPDMFDGEPSASILKINNSIWKNINQPGSILDSYKINIMEYYNGTSQNIEAVSMKDNINTWVNDNTYGRIPEIVDDSVKDSNIVLVNTLYLKDSWFNEFIESATKEQDFTTISGEKVKKDFMCKKDDYYFYEDKDSKVLILDTQSDIYVAFVLGNSSNITNKIKNSVYEEVIVELPKLDIESSFADRFLVQYLKSMGVNSIFDYTKADFSNMIELPEDAENVYVDDIIHKTKLVTDEKGIEGAAATAAMIMCGAMLEEPKEPKEFIADEPFSFYVFIDNFNYENENAVRFDDINLLFYGQNVK